MLEFEEDAWYCHRQWNGCLKMFKQVTANVTKDSAFPQ